MSVDHEDLREPLFDDSPEITRIDAITRKKLKGERIRKRNDEAHESHVWVFTAICGGILYGIGNFLMGNISSGGIYAREIIMVGSFISSVVYFTIVGKNNLIILSSKLCLGSIRKYTNKSFLKYKIQEMDYMAVAAILLDVVLTFIAGVVVLFTFKYWLHSGINQGVITALFSLGSLYLAIFAYFFYDQKITIFQISGMILLIACAILLVLSKNYDRIQVPYEYQTSPVIAVILAIISTIILWVRTILVKHFWEMFDIDSFTFTASSYFIGGFIFTVVSIVNFITYGESIGFVIQCVLSGMINAFGSILLNYSITTGHAGPAAALVNIQTVLHTILSAIILSQSPGLQQIIAMIIGLIGSISISWGKIIYRWVNLKFA